MEMETETETEMEIDRLSALPHDLLVRILGCVDVKQAATTSLLSKQWRFVWTDLPSLSFSEKTGQIEAAKGFKTDVDGALGSRRGAALEYLSVHFIYKEFMASSVDAWVELAAKNNAQHLNLCLRYGDDIAKPHPLHHSMYSNSWLKTLSLYHCIMPTPTATVEWRSMTRISLCSCILPQQAIDNIVSGCPALSSLSLRRCRGFNRLEIGGRSFRRLHVKLYQHGLLEISAPYMRSLYYDGDPGKGTLRLTNAVSLEFVWLRFRANAYNDVAHLDVITNAYQIFHSIRCANFLVLRDATLKVLSMMATNGCQLPQFKADCLRIDADSDVLNIHGAIVILESSPFLKSLRICGLPFPYNEEVIGSDPTTCCNLNCDLLHLKFVKIDVYVDMENSSKSTFKLAQTLLKRTPILEKLEIYISERQISASTNSKVSIEKFETLLSYPRSSHKAKIVIIS